MASADQSASSRAKAVRPATFGVRLGRSTGRRGRSNAAPTALRAGEIPVGQAETPFSTPENTYAAAALLLFPMTAYAAGGRRLVSCESSHRSLASRGRPPQRGDGCRPERGRRSKPLHSLSPKPG
ncbi:hypothetical protein CDD83_133 [Cordyceps sp. RAO-2017]|nr:hypothetical protein CDD83_133 [Cordyceps sp. RAO-2017]